MTDKFGINFSQHSKPSHAPGFCVSGYSEVLMGFGAVLYQNPAAPAGSERYSISLFCSLFLTVVLSIASLTLLSRISDMNPESIRIHATHNNNDM